MLTITNLHTLIEGKPILRGVSLTIKPGEIHAIMGPNGSGKSTLANTIMGHPRFTVTDGSIAMDGEEMVGLKADKRAQKGIFLAFQYPKDVPGVSVSAFIKTAIAAVRKAQGLTALSDLELRKKIRAHLEDFSLSSTFLNRSINEGFSGGEKKKVEILQMALLEPRMAILDETDSGLDVDALRVVSAGINRLASPTRGMLLITHYQRILHYVKPHFIHVMLDGRIVRSGGPELGERLEAEGYDWLRAEVAQEIAPEEAQVII